MTNKRVKVFTDIPSRSLLSNMIADYKASGAQVGWSEQDDGRYHLEVEQPEPSSQSEAVPSASQFTSPVTGQALTRG